MSSCRKTSFSFQEIILLSLLDALKRLMLTQWQQATPSHNVEQPACLVWFGLVELIVPEGQFVAQAAVKHKEIQAVHANDTHGSHMIQVFSKLTAKETKEFLYLLVGHLGKIRRKQTCSLFRWWPGLERMSRAFFLTLVSLPVNKALRFTPAALKHILKMASSGFPVSDWNHQMKVRNDSIKEGFFHKRGIRVKMIDSLIKIKAGEPLHKGQRSV